MGVALAHRWGFTGLGVNGASGGFVCCLLLDVEFSEFLAPCNHLGAGGVGASGVFGQLDDNDLTLCGRDNDFRDCCSKFGGDSWLNCVPFPLALVFVCPVAKAADDKRIPIIPSQIIKISLLVPLLGIGVGAGGVGMAPGCGAFTLFEGGDPLFKSLQGFLCLVGEGGGFGREFLYLLGFALDRSDIRFHVM